jgi:hypothetical protein
MNGRGQPSYARGAVGSTSRTATLCSRFDFSCGLPPCLRTTLPVRSTPGLFFPLTIFPRNVVSAAAQFFCAAGPGRTKAGPTNSIATRRQPASDARRDVSEAHHAPCPSVLLHAQQFGGGDGSKAEYLVQKAAQHERRG